METNFFQSIKNFHEQLDSTALRIHGFMDSVKNLLGKQYAHHDVMDGRTDDILHCDLVDPIITFLGKQYFVQLDRSKWDTDPVSILNSDFRDMVTDAIAGEMIGFYTEESRQIFRLIDIANAGVGIDGNTCETLFRQSMEAEGFVEHYLMSGFLYGIDRQSEQKQIDDFMETFVGFSRSIAAELDRVRLMFLTHGEDMFHLISSAPRKTVYQLITPGSNMDQIVSAMVILDCVNEEARKSQTEIIRCVDPNGDPCNYKRYFPQLQALGIAVKGSTGTGFFLAEHHLEELGVNKIDTSAPPTNGD